ncbi:YjcQ family protein [Bacillus sp. BAU-SS-2023]|nr:YjcQ family protein [Bacillus sp. BAU-SS-2023]
MKLDTKQKVLVAIYTEYQKDIPNMINNIKAKELGIDNAVFEIALDKLMNEGLITGVDFIKSNHQILVTYMDELMMTRDGIEYVETKLGIERTLSGVEKVQEIFKKSADWGWNEFKDITVKVLSEMGKHGMDKALGD